MGPTRAYDFVWGRKRCINFNFKQGLMDKQKKRMIPNAILTSSKFYRTVRTHSACWLFLTSNSVA